MKALALGLATPLFPGEPYEAPREDFWVPDGPVHVVQVTNGVVYVGGAFTAFSRPNSRASGGFDQFSGAADAGFPFVNGAVNTIIGDGTGGWFVGGQFTRVGDVPRNNLVRILPDRTVDPEWRADTDAAVLALAIVNDTLYVGGSFGLLDGKPRQYLGSVDVATGEVTDWDPGIPETSLKPPPRGVRTLVPARGLLYVGGGFSQIGGLDRENLAAIDPTSGRVTDWYPIAFDFAESGQVIDALAVQGDTVYIGGRQIRSINTIPRMFAAAFDATRATNNLLPWNPSANGPIYALGVSCEAIYVGGEFTRIGGEGRSNLAAVDPVSGAATDWNPAPDGAVHSLLQAGSTLYVGGQFARIGGQSRRHLAGIDVASGLATTWDPAPSFSVSSMSIAGNTVFAGGLSVGVHRRFLAALDARTGKPLDWDPDPNGHVYALAFSGSNLLLGGDFMAVGGQARNRLAAVNLNSGLATGWNPNVNGFERTNAIVESIVVDGNTVYVSGSLTNIGNQGRYHLAAIDLSTGQVLPWAPAANDDVRTLRLAGNTLYAGGRFTQINGQSRRRLAALDATTGAVLPWNPQANDAVRHVAVSGNRVIAGGLFSEIGGSPREHLAALDPNTGMATAWAPQAENTNRIGGIPRTAYVNASEPAGDTLYVGGWFILVAGEPRMNLAALDTESGSARPWAPLTDSPVIALVAADGVVYAGGVFGTVGGQFQPNLAVFPPVGSPRISEHPRGLRVDLGGAASLSAAAEGAAPLAYQWQLNGTNIPGAASSTLTLSSAQPRDAGEYTVVVTNVLGLIHSRPAELVVLQPLTILAQPQSQAVAPGSTVLLSVVVEGHPPPIYQWRLNGVNIPGAIYATLVVTNAQPADGGSYQVVVASLGGAASSDIATVLVTSPALGFTNNLSARGMIVGALGVGSGSNVGATKEAGEPPHVGVRGGRSVWGGWVAPATGIATFSTRGSSFDTLLAIYTGTDFASLAEVAADEDRGGFYTSQLTFNAVAGTEYLIAVDGFGGASGNIVLSWSLDTSTVEFPHILMQPLSQTVRTGETAIFSVKVSSPTPTNFQWFFECQPLAGETNATLTVPNVQAEKVGHYRVVVGNASSRVAESVAAALEIGPDRLVLTRDKVEDELDEFAPAPAGEAGVAPAPASLASISPGVLSVSVGTIDAQLFNNTGAGTSLGEPNHCGVLGGASRYLDLRAEQSGVLVIDTLGSRIDTVLAVYYRTNLVNLLNNQVACDNNGAPDGLRSRVRFNGEAGRTYRAFVDGVNAAQGEISLNWQMGLPPAFGPATDYTVRLGGRLVLQPEVTGASPPTRYQWLRNGVVVGGATNATLVLDPALSTHGGTYSVIGRNAFGATTSVVAVVTAEIPCLRIEPRLAGGMVRLWLQGPVAQRLLVESSADLQGWTPVWTNVMSSQPVFRDLPVHGFPSQFYRLRTNALAGGF